jgi:hypothetical protein
MREKPTRANVTSMESASSARWVRTMRRDTKAILPRNEPFGAAMGSRVGNDTTSPSRPSAEW